MKLATLLAVLFCACSITHFTSAEAYCSSCVESRASNQGNMNDTFYYEDYLEAQKRR